MIQSAAQTGEFGNLWRMVAEGTASTKVILVVLAVFSFASWAIIVLKLRQFRRLRRESDLFVDRLEKADRLEDAFHQVLALPESPFTRVFKRGMTFYSELRPGAWSGWRRPTGWKRPSTASWPFPKAPSPACSSGG